MITVGFDRRRKPRIRLGNKSAAFPVANTIEGRRRLGSPAPGPPPLYNGSPANLYEDIGDGSTEQSRAQMAQDHGKSVRVWQIQPANLADLQEAFEDILGYTQYTQTSTGLLHRELPLADPLYPWLYATSIDEIVGYSSYTQMSADGSLEAPPFNAGALWKYYRLTVTCQQSPFPVRPDSAITVNPGKWYPETSGGTSSQPFSAASEMLRYCTWSEQPQNDYVTRKGTVFACSSSNSTANNTTFTGDARVFLPNSLYKIVWYNVPLRLLTSAKSYLARWRGRVNQNEFIGPDARSFAPGSLLYLNFEPGKQFTRPVPKVVVLASSGGAYFPSISTTEKYTDVTLTFLNTTRALPNGEMVTAPSNKNYVTNGHNLLPCIPNLGFRYFQTQTGTPGLFTPDAPTFLSAPLELLFTDPESNNGQI